MTYKITIQKTFIETQPESQSYERVMSDAEKEKRLANDETNLETWGYVIKPTHDKIVSKEVFNQTVDHIDILSIIAAVNGLNFP